MNAGVSRVTSLQRGLRTLADLLDAARAKPGDLTVAGSGFFFIAFEMLKRVAHLNMTFVPYPGAAPAVTALLGEHVTSVFTDYATLAEQLKSGKLRPLATGSRTRAERRVGGLLHAVARLAAVDCNRRGARLSGSGRTAARALRDAEGQERRAHSGGPYAAGSLSRQEAHLQAEPTRRCEPLMAEVLKTIPRRGIAGSLSHVRVLLRLRAGMAGISKFHMKNP
jgi:hypothetical protein